MRPGFGCVRTLDFWCRGGLRADHALGVLGVYPFLRVLLITVPPLRRVTFFKRQKGNRKGLLLRSALAGSGSFAAGSIRAQRLRFASLHLLPLCSTSSNGRCAPTPGSIPPLSLPTSPVDQDQEHSSLRSLSSGAASPRAAALLAFLWERACSRRRPDSRPDCPGCDDSNCRSEPARDDAVSANHSPSDVLDLLWERACSRKRSDSQFISTRQFTLPSYSFFRNLRS
ncbi:hypothetical protein ABIA54_001241 [Pseudomonas sp. EB276 TE3739]